MGVGGGRSPWRLGSVSAVSRKQLLGNYMTVRWSDETRGGLWASRVFVVGSQVMEDVISGVHAQVLDRVLRQCLTLLLKVIIVCYSGAC